MAEASVHEFPAQVLQNIFGIEKAKDQRFADNIVQALGRIDRGLLPPAASHPLGHLIIQGSAAFDELLKLIESGHEQEQLDAIDAISHILMYSDAPEAVLLRLQAELGRSEDPTRRSYLAKCLAIGKDHGFLYEQLRHLDDDDPGIVATAARLLGFGRFVPALSVLRELVSPDRIFESRYVIWAIGEIGLPEALSTLENALASSFRSIDCMIAMGKIGQISSIGKLTPMIIEGLAEQRDAAYRALAMILDKNREISTAVEELTTSLSGIIHGQFSDDKIKLSGSTRFHMALCLARLGVKLDPPTVRQYLKIDLDDNEAGGMASYFLHRGGK